MAERKAEGAGQTPTWEAGHWTALQDLYHLAAELPPGERTRVLRAATRDDNLVQRVLDMLAVEALPQSLPVPRQPSEDGRRLGSYELVSLLGAGGLGSVYLAQRVLQGVVQRCAVKVLSLHAAGDAMQARFLREQQIIALLDHPHITRMLDVGVSDEGQAFLVMELVEGVSITQHCDNLRLGVRERIALLLQVCDAVAYAHRMLVVHLDLKPSNILVTADSANAKLLDFGTSKLVAPESALTTTVLVTPAYASPEQLRNEPVSTACDVYGLGAVMYEVLSGNRPWRNASPTVVLEHALREDEPAPVIDALTAGAAQVRGQVSPAALRQSLRGDLQSIVSRCLRSRPAARYSSVDELSADLRRFLKGRPVLARRQTTRYRVGKFLSRHRGGMVVSAGVLLVLLAAAGYGYNRRQQALRQGERAERMQTFIYSLLRLASSNVVGRPTTTISDFLSLGVRVLPELISNPDDQRAAQLSLAEAMFDNSDYSNALPVFLHAMESAKKAGDIPSEAEAEAYAGMSAGELGQAGDSQRLVEHAMSLVGHRGVTPLQRMWIVDFYVSSRGNRGVREAADIVLLQKAVSDAKQAGVPNRELAGVVENLAVLLSQNGRMQEAASAAAESLSLYRREPYTECAQGEIGSLFADLKVGDGHFAEALDLYRAAGAAVAACKGPGDVSALYLQAEVAQTLTRLGRPVEAISLLEPALPQWRRVGAGSPHFRRALIFLTQSYLAAHRFADGEASAREALRLESGSEQPGSPVTAVTCVLLGRALLAQHRDREALPFVLEADQAFQTMAAVPANLQPYRDGNRQQLAALQTGAAALAPSKK